VGAHKRFRSTPGQIQLSIESVETVGEDAMALVVCDAEELVLGVTVEDDEEELVLLLGADVLELELVMEEEGELVDEAGAVVEELVRLDEEVGLLVVVLLGKVAT
jgi:hypothetical protein